MLRFVGSGMWQKFPAGNFFPFRFTINNVQPLQTCNLTFFHNGR
jgi:hypothetical protein